MDNVEANMNQVNEESDAMIKKGKQKIADISQKITGLMNEVSFYFESFSNVLIT